MAVADSQTTSRSKQNGTAANRNNSALYARSYQVDLIEVATNNNVGRSVPACVRQEWQGSIIALQTNPAPVEKHTNITWKADQGIQRVYSPPWG